MKDEREKMTMGVAFVRSDTGEVVEVFQSFNGSWMSGIRRKSGAYRRFKTPRCPPQSLKYDAERDLIDYATERGWEPFEGE